MRHWYGAIVALLLVAVPLRGQEIPAELRALDQAIQTAVARAEKCVVSIRIGRDEAHDRLDGKLTREPGQLGRFDIKPHLAKLADDDTTGRRRLEDLDLANSRQTPEATATGLVLDRTGLILVPAHAVTRAKKVYVTLAGGKGSYADIHALDPRSDLAVLRLLDPPDHLVEAILGDGGAIKRGQLVMVLACPFAAGFAETGPSATWGMVKNLRQRLPAIGGDAARMRQTLHHFGTLMEIDTRLAIPTSGGVVLNLKGEAVGLSTAHAAVLGDEKPGADVPAGYAIPMDDAMRRIIAVLRKGEEVEYGFLGVTLSAGGIRGVEISGVSPGSPARLAGLVGGETIMRIDGRPINDAEDLFLAAGTKLAGSNVQVEYQVRGGLMRTATLKVAKFWYPIPSIASRRPAHEAGLRVDWGSLMSQRKQPAWLPQMGPRLPAGVIISEVVASSSAAKAGLLVDDYVTHVGSTPVTTPEEFYKAMTAVEGKVTVTYINGDGQSTVASLTR